MGREVEGTPNERRERARLKCNLFGCPEAHLLHIPFVPAYIALEQPSLDGREGSVD